MKASFKETIKRAIGKNLKSVTSNGSVKFVTHLNNVESEVGIGSYGTINVFAFQSGGRIVIGKYTSISEISVIMGGNHHRGISVYPFKVLSLHKDVSTDNNRIESISIGNDCWIGLNAVVMDGVTIGDGAIIGANAVIAKDVEPYSVVVGNPGRAIAMRFDSNSVDKLLRLKWWDLPYRTIIENVDSFYLSSIDEFEIEYRRLRQLID